MGEPQQVSALLDAIDVLDKAVRQRRGAIPALQRMVAVREAIKPGDADRPLKRVLEFVDELAEAVDCGAADIGGCRGEKAILSDLVSASMHLTVAA
ncbi:MAG: hypothetical protein E5W82_10630 [Mesorhizobium sp.]|nr:MAG: hypothetical protein E5W82_10630 [Mesorhizobium sp.]